MKETFTEKLRLSNKNKEEIFNIIDEYMDLKHDSYTIRFDKGSESKGFGIMMSVGQFRSYEKGEYSINGLIKRRLDKKKIKYKIIDEHIPKK